MFLGVSRFLGAPVPVDEALPTLPAHESILAGTIAAGRFHAPEDGGACDITGEDADPVLRISVARKTANIWDAGLNWDTAGPVKAGDMLLLVFEMRSLTDTPAEIRAVFRRSTKPYDHALGETCQAERAWREQALAFPAKVDLDSGKGVLIMNLGAKAQTLELRRVRLLNFAERVSQGALLRTLKRSPPTSPRSVVGEQLNPELLWDMDAYSALRDVNTPFDPEGSWSHTYAIWTCHGYMRQANKNVGLLTLTHEPAAQGGGAKLQIKRALINDTGECHNTTAAITCAGNPLCTPAAWQVTNEVVQPGRSQPDPLLTVTESARRSDKGYSVTVNGNSVLRDWAPPLTSDWCLFAAVQRLDPEALPKDAFTVLEGLSLPKGGARFVSGGVHQIALGEKEVTLRRIDLLLHGALPYEFWLDAQSRLVMVVTHSRAYILQPDAEERFSSYAEGRIRRAERAQAQRAAAQAKEMP